MVKKRPFRMVFQLWLAPDFSRVMAGLDVPPWIDHDAVDFQRLRDVLAKEFRYGEPVRIRVPNDTVDQVTVHTRQAKGDVEGLRCSDFARMLLQEAHKQTTDVIEVRQPWEPLHSMPDRHRAPPPILIPFVVEADDYEDAILWAQQARMALRVRAASPEYMMSKVRQDDDHQGYLTPGLHEILHSQFDVAYQPYILLDEGASDPKPQWASDALNLARH